MINGRAESIYSENIFSVFMQTALVHAPALRKSVYEGSRFTVKRPARSGRLLSLRTRVSARAPREAAVANACLLGMHLPAVDYKALTRALRVVAVSSMKGRSNSWAGSVDIAKAAAR